jgi:MoaA/NifB/PqqE/SkfB family radical SAM enzyme
MDAISPEKQKKMRKSVEIKNQTINLIEYFNNLGTPVNVKTLVTKANKTEIKKIAGVLNKLPIKYWTLIEFIALNRGKINQNNFMLASGEFDEICAFVKKAYPAVDIRIRMFTKDKNPYCFIAPNGDVYTYLKGKGDVVVGSLVSEKLRDLIIKIEK